jgi:hypothetical protein
MKTVKILVLAFSLGVSSLYGQRELYDPDDVTNYAFDDGKGGTIRFDQLSNSEQSILKSIYAPYKKLDKSTLDKVYFTGTKTIVYFYSKKCNAAKSITSEIEKIKAKGKIKLVMIDTQNNKNFIDLVPYVPTAWFINSKGEFRQEIGRKEEMLEKIDLFIHNQF